MPRATLTTAFALVAAGTALAVRPVAGTAAGPTSDYPQIAVRITERAFFGRGDPVRVWFRVTADAHVAVFRIDTDGRIRVLFPLAPGADDRVRGGASYEIVLPSRERGAFVVDDYPGTGYVFALASMEPLDYRAVLRDDDWDFRSVSHNERVRGDPHVAVTDLVERIVPEGYAAWTYDLVPYLVERRYDSPPSWDPYRDWCGTFRQVWQDDPFIHLVTGFPAMGPPLWYPPIVPTPITVAARGATTGSVRGSAPPPAAPRAGGSRGPLGTIERVLRGNRGGVRRPTTARGGHGVAPRERPAPHAGPTPGPGAARRPDPATPRGGRGTAPRHTVLAGGARSHR